MSSQLNSQPHILCRHVRQPSLRHAVLTRLRYGDLCLRAKLCPPTRLTSWRCGILQPLHSPATVCRQHRRLRGALLATDSTSANGCMLRQAACAERSILLCTSCMPHCCVCLCCCITNAAAVQLASRCQWASAHKQTAANHWQHCHFFDIQNSMAVSCTLHGASAG